jgi:hypothetical protein
VWLALQLVAAAAAALPLRSCRSCVVAHSPNFGGVQQETAKSTAASIAFTPAWKALEDHVAEIDKT